MCTLYHKHALYITIFIQPIDDNVLTFFYRDIYTFVIYVKQEHSSTRGTQRYIYEVRVFTGTKNTKSTSWSNNFCLFVKEVKDTEGHSKLNFFSCI